MPMSLLGAMITATAEPELIDDAALIIREGVGAIGETVAEVAKAAAPEAAPEPAPTHQTAREQAAAPEPVAQPQPESVAEVAEAAAPEVAPHGEQAAAPPRQETPEEQEKRFEDMMEAARRENEKDQSQEMERGGRGR